MKIILLNFIKTISKICKKVYKVFLTIPNPIMGRILKARTNRSLLIEIRVYLTGGGAWCGDGGGGGSLPVLAGVCY